MDKSKCPVKPMRSAISMTFNKINLYVVSQKGNHLNLKPPYYSIFSDTNEYINISDKINYCELRAQYYVWKNCLQESMFVGFFHFRRYLDFSCNAIQRDGDKHSPYNIIKNPKYFNYDYIIKELNGFDVIAPKIEYTGITVRQRYGISKGHRLKDLICVENIINEKYPDFISAKNLYLGGKSEYFCNMFIMTNKMFSQYCSWLFDILFEFDKREKNAPPKTNGFLGERLFGIYYTWLKQQEDVYCGELPRVHFWCYDDENHNFKKDKIINIFLPPGSKIRGCIKKIINK